LKEASGMAVATLGYQVTITMDGMKWRMQPTTWPSWEAEIEDEKMTAQGQYFVT